MDRAFESAALVTPPTPPASPSLGYPTNGNPGTGTPATIPGDWWYHMLTEELRNVIVAAGLTPDRTAVNQLLQALPGALASRPEMARSLTGSGYQKIPGGLILQWGAGAATPSNATNIANWYAGTQVITLPIMFPTLALQPFVSAGNSPSTQVISAGAAALTTSQITAIAWSTQSGLSVPLTWWALGF